MTSLTRSRLKKTSSSVFIYIVSFIQILTQTSFMCFCSMICFTRTCILPTKRPSLLSLYRQWLKKGRKTIMQLSCGYIQPCFLLSSTKHCVVTSRFSIVFQKLSPIKIIVPILVIQLKCLECLSINSQPTVLILHKLYTWLLIKTIYNFKGLVNRFA